MEHFQVGDKVRCINSDTRFLTNGSEYVIKKIIYDYWNKTVEYINLEGVLNDYGSVLNFWPSRFELISHKVEFQLDDSLLSID